ncbi:MAG TPA: hypothetical protein VFC47_16285 [Caulobacteraceae bacterium]|nr:hypothetical protein [Caulobacteraceae bacterium]
MTPSHFAAVAAALLFSTVAASAQAAADTTAAPAATQPAPVRTAQDGRDPNRVICKREETVGTRLGGTKECHTAVVWDEIGHEGQSSLQSLQSQRANMNPAGH